MLNKKAIAAFAAGATLLSGLAFAAPAFAEGTGDQTTPKTDQTTPKTDQGKKADQGKKDDQSKKADQGKKDDQSKKADQGKKDDQSKKADQGKKDDQSKKDDNWQYETEDPGALADRLNAEKAAKVAADEKDKYEHTPFGNMDTDYKKCVKLYGEDALECKAVADYLKRHGQKVDDKANDKKSDKKSEAKKSSEKKAAPLAKTGAAVALAAVAASVLAGMGVALRKIRH
ncbi:peptidase [Gardnerella swidsinskii]|uniref:Peptidase n=1 Tax=Gardnerella swidsinskii TaxID=2792979 RepID=A0ABN4V717_9BIFI|nr:peptidase [Gardnerella vaginalis]